ncbi:MAG: hypothetical protein F6K42_17160 [Leptolyngbya sp. SIO1D8]|nr:hypothetical protein [Leptolyngbya sp. SIO1D8]
MTDSLSPTERKALLQALSSLPPPTFDEVLFVLNLPSGTVPGGQASQGKRAAALLEWAEGSTGRGLREVYELLTTYVPNLKTIVSDTVTAAPGSKASASETLKEQVAEMDRKLDQIARERLTINITNSNQQSQGDHQPVTEITNNNQGANIANLVNEAKDNAQVTASNFTQTSGTSTAELLQIINALRQTVTQFPQDVQEDIIIDIEDVEEEIKKPAEQRNMPRLKKRLAALVTAASMIAGSIAAANEFADDVIDLGSKVGIELQLPQSQ